MLELKNEALQLFWEVTYGNPGTDSSHYQIRESEKPGPIIFI